MSGEAWINFVEKDFYKILLLSVSINDMNLVV